MVFNNKTLLQICDTMPTTKDELLKIYGLGENKVELFGQSVIDLVELHKSSNKDVLPTEVMNSRTKFLIGVRNRIAKYNSISKVEDCFDNVALTEIAVKLPRNIEELKLITNFPETNIELFGDYLIKRITELIKE